MKDTLKKLHKDRVLLGFSGGVDSTAAALLLRKAGYSVTGLFLMFTKKKAPMLNWPKKPLLNWAFLLSIEMSMRIFQGRSLIISVGNMKKGVPPIPAFCAIQPSNFRCC